MQIKLFTIPTVGGNSQEEEMNVFLRSKKIIDIEKHFAVIGNAAFWTFCIRYINTIVDSQKLTRRPSEKVDYKTTLDSDSFDRFSKYRELRKKIAKEEAIPAYAVFTDAELANIAKLELVTQSKLLSIEGIGVKKVEKYGKHFENVT